MCCVFFITRPRTRKVPTLESFNWPWSWRSSVFWTGVPLNVKDLKHPQRPVALFYNFSSERIHSWQIQKPSFHVLKRKLYQMLEGDCRRSISPHCRVPVSSWVLLAPCATHSAFWRANRSEADNPWQEEAFGPYSPSHQSVLHNTTDYWCSSVRRWHVMLSKTLHPAVSLMFVRLVEV